MHSFSLFEQVIRKQKDLLITSAFAGGCICVCARFSSVLLHVGLVIWILFSALMYAAEKNNPNPSIADEVQ